MSFYFNLFSPFKRALYFFAIPVLQAGENIKGISTDLISHVRFKEDLIKENNFLEQELSRMKAELVIKDMLLIENLELKAILGRKVNDNIILASVIAKPNSSIYDSLVIDAGGDENIAIGDKVFAYGNIVLGEISEVGHRYSKVKLYSSYGEKYQAIIGEDKIATIAYGKGGGNFEVKLPRDVEVKNGDFVTLLGIYPGMFGVVEEIFLDKVDSFKSVLFKSPVNIFELKYVQVLRI